VVTAPDQHKPGAGKAARIGAVASAVILLLMLIGNHRGNVENIFLIATAALLILALVIDWVLRREGIKR
jgi:Protein of unknown function (DUF2631)